MVDLLLCLCLLLRLCLQNRKARTEEEAEAEAEAEYQPNYQLAMTHRISRIHASRITHHPHIVPFLGSV